MTEQEIKELEGKPFQNGFIIYEQISMGEKIEFILYRKKYSIVYRWCVKLIDRECCLNIGPVFEMKVSWKNCKTRIFNLFQEKGINTENEKELIDFILNQLSFRGVEFKDL